MNPMLARVATITTMIFLIDRATKFWVVEVLDLRARGFIAVWDPWFNLAMAWNRGINFGLLDMGADAGRWALIALALVICAGLLYWARRRTAFVEALGVGLIMGGAFGNVWDRIRYGAVMDFLNFSLPGLRNPFAFNVGDVAIFAGAALLLLFAREPTLDRPSGGGDARKGR